MTTWQDFFATHDEETMTKDQLIAALQKSKYKDNRHGDLMQHFRGFLSGPNRCPGCAGHGITDRGTTCKACLGDGKLTSAVRGYSVTPCTAPHP